MNEVVDVTIEELGIKGDGVALLPDGRRIFVAGTLPGERVRLLTGAERPEGVSGKLIEILESSQDRVSPPCAYFGQCGGCALQHWDMERYSHFKVSRVMQALARAGLEPEETEGPFTSAPGSRRRAVLSAKCADAGRVELGFNERASHILVAIDSCAVLRPALTAMLPVLRQTLARVMRAGESYDVALAESQGAVDILITVLGKGGRTCDKNIRDSLQDMAATGPVARVSWQATRLQKAEIVVQRSACKVNFAGYEAEPPPGAFLQATAEGEQALAEFAVAAIGRKGRIADLYAGCGTFTFALLAQGHKVDAFEGDVAALGALAAAGAGISHLKTARRDLAREPLTFQELKVYDAVVIDPPRAGALRQAEEIVHSVIRRVVSISCNPDSFARDGAILAQGGFRLMRLRVVDQFLWSPHVEVAGLFTRT